MSDLLSNVTKIGVREGVRVPDLAKGMNGGIMDPNDLYQNMPAVYPASWFILTSAPRMYDNDPVMRLAIKNFFEVTTKFSGMELSYETQMEAVQVSRDSQPFEVPTGINRAPIAPVFNAHELPGSPLWHLIYTWSTDIVNPDSGFGFHRMESGLAWTPENIAASGFVIVPDMSGSKAGVQMAYYVTNLMPKNTGEFGGGERVPGPGKVVERSFNFSGFIHHNETIVAQGAELFDAVQARKLDPNKIATINNTVAENLLEAGALAKYNQMQTTQNG